MRLAEGTPDQASDWKAIGAYLSERAWGTVREDYSADGNAWEYFTYENARSRAYRWSEDELAGICDRNQKLCFALAVWNGQDPFIKERMFGLTNGEGNHGEDVKEYYWYADATPTACWLSWIYHYPQAAFPYARLREENARRSRNEREFELSDTGIFDEGRYWKIGVEYAKVAAIRSLHSHSHSQRRAGSGETRGSPDALVSQPLVLGGRRQASCYRRRAIGRRRRFLRKRRR